MVSKKVTEYSKQSIFARRRQVRDIQEQNENATIIQSLWRSYMAQTEYAFAILAVISLQSLVRCRSASQKYQQLQLKRAKAAVTIQSAFRCHIHYNGKNFLGHTVLPISSNTNIHHSTQHPTKNTSTSWCL